MAEENASGGATLEKRYGEFYSARNSDQVYPVEFVVRTLLGTYPGLRIDRTVYRGSKVLDLGFGDGRNMPLLHDLGFRIHGVEISAEICALARTRLERLSVPTILKTGNNSHIPFEDDSFDCVLSCHSCHYIAPGEKFSDNLNEIARVLRPGGRFIFSLPNTDTYILNGAESLGQGYFSITRDPYGIRNGTVFRAFASREEVTEELRVHFADLSLGRCENDFYGIYEKVWIGTGLRKPL